MALPISNWLSLLANMNNEVFRCPETRKWRSYLFDERIGDGDYPSMETGCYKTLWGVYRPPWPKTTAPHNATLSDVFRLFWGPRTLVQKVKNLCQTFKEFPFILTYSTYIYIYIYIVTSTGAPYSWVPQSPMGVRLFQMRLGFKIEEMLGKWRCLEEV